MADYILTKEQTINMLTFDNMKLREENGRLKEQLEYKSEVLGDLETENKQLKEKIQSLGNDMRAVDRQSMSEECLVGFNMAVAITNKHLGKGEDYEH